MVFLTMCLVALNTFYAGFEVLNTANTGIQPSVGWPGTLIVPNACEENALQSTLAKLCTLQSNNAANPWLHRQIEFHLVKFTDGSWTGARIVSFSGHWQKKRWWLLTSGSQEWHMHKWLHSLESVENHHSLHSLRTSSIIKSLSKGDKHPQMSMWHYTASQHTAYKRYVCNY